MALLPPLVVFLLAATVYLLSQHLAQAAPVFYSDWLPYARVAAAVVLWLSAAWLGRRLLALAVTRHATRRQNKGVGSLMIHGGPQLVIDLGGLGLFIGAILIIVARVFGQPLGGLLATSGVFAAVVGFAMQRTISDVFSGLALNLERPFVVGDWLEIQSGVVGKVVDANWRAVRLATIEGRSIVVPNSILSSNQFVNLDAPESGYRTKRTICLDYSVPSERVVPILQTAMEMTPGVPAKPAPVVLIEQCGDNGVVYSLNFWVPNYPESFAISRQVVMNALKCLDQAGFAPAYPKRDISTGPLAPRRIEYRVDLHAVLSRAPLLRALDKDSLADLESKVALQEFAANRAIVQEGDAGESLFVVISGMLEARQNTQDGSQRVVGKLVAGEVFGEMSLLTGARRSATVTAVTPVTLVEIGRAELEPILAANPSLITELSEIEAERMLANMTVARLAGGTGEEDHASGFAAILRERIRRFFGHTKAT